MGGREIGANKTMLSVPRPGALEGVSNSELLDRIMTVERQMTAVMANSPSKSSAEELYETPAHSIETATTDHRTPEPLLNVDDDDGHTFVGETSMLHALRQTEAQFDNLGAEFRPNSPLSNGRPLTPKFRSTVNINAEKNSRSWLRSILLSYGIVPDKTEYDTLLYVFFDELHILYPFLHPPTVRQTYNYLWQRSLLVSSDDLEQDGESRISVAIVFICLANGRCTASSRVDNADASHSAGWSLYSVATYLLRQFLDMAFDSAITLHGLQASSLMVLYLFRLDASEKAERILAHTISSAHILGLHRKATYSNMHAFEDEMFTRVWWCLYILDRRISLSAGRPFIIQDLNNDTRKPLNVSDDWLEQHKLTAATVSELENEIKIEALVARNTVIPYLEATISYSRAAGEVWKAVYGVDKAESCTPSIMCDYLDILLEKFDQSPPPYLQYRLSVPFEDQFSGLEWWQIKQCLFNHMRYSFLKVLIRRPGAPSNGLPPSTHDTITNEAVCAQLSSSIIDVFDKVPTNYPKYGFPFISYVMSATMILVSIVTKNPKLKDRYRKSIISAVQSMLYYCRKTWVSGKTIRTVSKLNRMVRSTLDEPTEKNLEKMQNRHVEEQGQRKNYSELKEGTVLAATRSSLPPLATTEASEQQFIPQYWHTPPSPLAVQQNNGTSPASTYSATSNIPIVSAQAHPTQPARRPSQPSESQIQQPGSILPTGEDILQTPFLWSPAALNNTFTDLPSWAMTDFDFEQAFSGSGNLRSTSFTTQDLLDFEDEYRWQNIF